MHRRTAYRVVLQDEALDDKDALYAVFEDLIKGIDFSFKQGDVVSGTVFEIDQKGAYLDIGAKSAAFCPTAEVSLCKIGRVCRRVHCYMSACRVALEPFVVYTDTSAE